MIQSPWRRLSIRKKIEKKCCFILEKFRKMWHRFHSDFGPFCPSRGPPEGLRDILSYLHNPFFIMRGPRQLLFFQLVVLLHRSKRQSNRFWAYRMFEISSQKWAQFWVFTSKMWTIFWQKVPSQFSMIRWPRELIFGGLVVLLDTTQRRTIGFWAHRML